MATRIQKGLRRLNPVVARSVIPGRNFEPAWLGPALGILALGGLIFMLIFQRQAVSNYLAKRKNILWFTFFLFGLFYIFFTWYVAGSSAETRFVVPLLGPFYLLLADVIVSLIKGLGHWLKAKEIRFFTQTETGVLTNIYRVTLVLIIGWGVWWLINTALAERWALTIDPYESDRKANHEPEAIVQWLSRDNSAGEVLVTFGPSKSLPLWKFPARFTFDRLPVDVDTWPAMEAYLQTEKPDYIIIDQDTARRRRQALSDYFQYQRDPDLVMFEQIPPGWALDFAYPETPCRWCIFSPVDNTQPIATFDGGVELLAWQIAHHQDNLHVTLTWRTQNFLPLDYTIFTHLTARDGFVKAQHDRQPFAGARPTSQWQPGEILADRYDLFLDASVTPGDYLLLAGLYDPNTGERVETTGGPSGPTPATVLLGTVEIK